MKICPKCGGRVSAMMVKSKGIRSGRMIQPLVLGGYQCENGCSFNMGDKPIDVEDTGPSV